MQHCEKHQQDFLLNGDSPHLRDCPECAAFARDSGRFLAARLPPMAPSKNSDRFIIAHAAAARPARVSKWSRWRLVVAAALPAAAALIFCLLPANQKVAQEGATRPIAHSQPQDPRESVPVLDLGGACINEELKVLEQDLITLDADLTFVSN